MTAGNPVGTVANVTMLEERFAFIASANLRQNVTACFQYIIFLSAIQDAYSKGSDVESSLCRDIVVHTASIVEASLHYAVTELVRRDEVSLSSLAKEWTFKNAHDIHTISPTEKIVWATKVLDAKAFKDNATSQDINNAAKAANLIDDNLYSKAEKIRTMRNNIHVIGEQRTVVYPTKADVTAIFDDTRLILKSIEKKLAPTVVVE